MKTTSKNVFIQIDAKALLQNLGGQAPSCEDIRPYTLIYDQGSMSLGDAVKNFDVMIETSQTVYFSILPFPLYSNFKLFFTRFEVTENNGGITVPSDITLTEPQLSFHVPIQNTVKDGQARFVLYGLLEYLEGDEIIQIPISIDPVLRANQGRG